MPGSDRYLEGCNIVRKFGRRCGAKKPELLTCVRLRKHIATVCQVLNLQKNEIGQLAKFLGHSQKTFEEYYQ